jgi:hypothetical protein
VQVDDLEQPSGTVVAEQAEDDLAIRRRTTAFFTLAEVVARTGAKRRAVQMWADGGVIESTAETDRAGTGVHRVYCESEAQIAAILAALVNNISMPIGELRQLAKMIRPYMLSVRVFAPGELFDSFTDKLDPVGRRVARGLRRAIDGTGENYLCLAFEVDNLWLDMKTDEEGPVCLNPRRDFTGTAIKSRPVVVVLDLTDLLHGLID